MAEREGFERRRNRLILERICLGANFGTFKTYLRNPRLSQHALPTRASLGSGRTISDQTAPRKERLGNDRFASIIIGGSRFDATSPTDLPESSPRALVNVSIRAQLRPFRFRASERLKWEYASRCLGSR